MQARPVALALGLYAIHSLIVRDRRIHSTLHSVEKYWARSGNGICPNLCA